MSKAKGASAPSPTGIFGPDWFKWRSATLRVEIEGEPPFAARLDAVQRGVATITELDASGRPTIMRELPWPPPNGTVRVVRAP